MSHKQVLQSVIAVILVLSFLVGCGGSAPTAVSEAPAATSEPEQAAATPTPEPPTSTPEPPTATPVPPTPTPSGPKVGHWEGEGHWEGKRSVSFEIGADGNINGFKMDIKIPNAACTVTSDKVIIEADGTFVLIFGEPISEGENTIQGKFESNTTVTGSYSKQIYCVDLDSGKGVYGILSDNVDRTWSAEWKRP